MSIINFKPIPTITPANDYWENKKWRFNIPAITVGVGDTPQPIVVTVSSIGAVTLVNAIDDGLEYLKLFGGTKQGNLPSGYTQVEYLEIATEGAYFSTGINATVDTDMGITASNITSNSAQILVAQCESGSDYFRIAKAGASQRVIGSFGSSTVTDNNTDGVNKFTARMNKSGFYVNGSLVGTFSNIPSSLTDVGEIDIFRGKYGSALYYAYVGSRFSSVWIDDNIFFTCRRNSDNQLGIYNTKTGQFILPSGEGTFTAGADIVPTPTTPMDIVCNNGAVKVSKNLFDYRYFYTNYQNYSTSAVGRCPIKLKPNTTYTISTNTDRGSASASMFVVSGNAIDWAPATVNNGILVDSPRTVTTDGNGYLCFGIYVRSDSAIPESDFINGTVWAQIEQGSTATPYMPYGEIYTDGTNETVEITGKNLFDIATAISSKGISASTGEINSASAVVSASDYIPVSGGENYTLNTQSWITQSSGIAWYNANKEYISGQAYTGLATQTFTAPANAYYARITVRTDQNPFQFELGSTATTYEPYTVLGTATAENLFKVGTYQDIQEVISGSVTRRIGIKVLDGTEDWIKGTSFYTDSISTVSNVLQATHTVFCTHYQGISTDTTGIGDSNTCKIGSNASSTIFWGRIYIYANRSLYNTAEDFANYLVDQYANGTPVILVYPLQTPTTETVTAQPMNIQAGTNIGEITQASIDNLELEVSYKQSTI